MTDKEKKKNTDKNGGQLVRLDSFQRYLMEIGQFHLLTAEEEHRLAVDFQKTQDPQLAYQMVTANLRLVVKIALEYRNYYQNVLDLIQEGNIGLMQAVKRFDPYRGVRLPSYAQWWIRAYILKFILENFSLIKIGTTQAQRKLFFRLKREQEKLIKEGLGLDNKLLAERIDVSEKEVGEMRKRLAAPEASLDSTHPTTGKSMMDSLVVDAQNPEDHAAEDELRERVRKAMDDFRQTLDEREQTVWDARISTDTPKTFQEIGNLHGITRQRVQQVEQRLKQRFKEFLKLTIPEADERLTY